MYDHTESFLIIKEHHRTKVREYYVLKHPTIQCHARCHVYSPPSLPPHQTFPINSNLEAPTCCVSLNKLDSYINKAMQSMDHINTQRVLFFLALTILHFIIMSVVGQFINHAH